MISKLRIHSCQIPTHLMGDMLRMKLSEGGDVSSPEQAVAINDSIIISCTAFIRHPIGSSDALLQGFSHRRGDDDVGRNRQKSPSQFPEFLSPVSPAAKNEVPASYRSLTGFEDPASSSFMEFRHR